MRMRHKPNLVPRMEKCAAVMAEHPEEMKGKWRSGEKKLYLEIGCGKGSFTRALAQSEPDALIVAIEKEPNAMVMAMEKAIESGIENIRFIDADAANLGEIFEKGEVDMIFINHPDPWPKSRDAKLRLTSPAFLRSYATALKDNGEIRFKTDNLPLFNWSIEQLKSENWDLEDVDFDRHSDIMTDYEKRFVAQGVKINGLTAVKNENTKSMADGVPERLRNASLSDAKGNQQ